MKLSLLLSVIAAKKPAFYDPRKPDLRSAVDIWFSNKSRKSIN